MTVQPSQNQTPLDQREAGHQRRMERRESRGGSFVFGAILIVLGILFLMQNIGSFDFPFENWWALFILIPAIASFERAYSNYRAADNQFTAGVGGALLSGIVLTLVTAAFLFNFGWTYFGPILIIIAGLGILMNSLFNKNQS
jgi:uncharacterized membrane protein YdbT with pleckstrin-like domain